MVHLNIMQSLSKLFSLPGIQFPVPENEVAARNLAGTVRSFPLPLGFCCILHSRKLQPATQIALSEVTLSLGFFYNLLSVLLFSVLTGIL